MADDEEIKIIIGADDQATEKLKNVSKTAADTGKNMKDAGETGRLGMFAMGEAAENAAQKMGVPNQVSRQLGNTVERLAGSLGMAGAAFGVVGLAVTAGISVWQRYTEEQRKAREELMKLSDAAGDWARQNEKQTMGLSLASYNQYLAERKKRTEELAKGIEAEEKALKGLALRTQETYTIEVQLDNIETRTLKNSPERIEAAKKELEQRKATLAVRRAELAMLESRPKTFQEFAGEKEQSEGLAKMRAGLRAYQAEVISSERDLYYARNAMAAQFTQQQVDEELRAAALKREAFMSTPRFLAESFQAMYQAGGQHAQRNFRLFKMAAKAEALMNADRAAASSYAWGSQLGGPVLGGVMAGIAYLAGLARVKSIDQMTLEGGGSGPAGATPTYSASPTTGQPQNGGNALNLTLVIDGQRQTYNIKQTTRDVIMELDRNNGTIDGVGVQMVRFA